MPGRRTRISRHEDANCKVAQIRHVELHGIAYYERAGWDGDGRSSAERQCPVGPWQDRRRHHATQCDMRSSNDYAARAESGQPHAQPRASDTDVHDLAERLIVETRIGQSRGAEIRLVQRVAPSPDPVFIPLREG